MLYFLVIASKESAVLFTHRFNPQLCPCHPAGLASVIEKCMVDSRTEKPENFVEDTNESRTLVYRWFGACMLIASADSDDNLLQVYEFLNLYLSALSQYFPNLSRHTIIQNPAKLHIVLEEMVIGGVIVETSPAHALSIVRLLDDINV
ncbi:AP-4 complex subunit sigma-1 [Hyalella azteca]|uniref:AP-4 complex subunit sigma-1 n=1 Tax=Hyalella azteca TaxID=294128 RepID=A0A8B7NBH4_HYAAZ|nr:AP-4 complex subunit sigma-1 [Hyalella azteca]